MKKREVYLISFFLISFLFYFFSSVIPTAFLQNLTQSGSEIRASLYSVAHAQSKNETIQKLESENKRLKEQLLELESIKKDNIALRSQFEETFLPSSELLPAKIIGFRGKFTAPTALFIDQGEKSGVKPGQAVVVGRELVGKVGAVRDFISEVLLTNSQKFSTLSYTNKTNAPGILYGREDVLLLDNVVITDTLTDGDLVLTKGEVAVNGSIIPEGLLIGSITSINKSESKPFQSAVVKSPIESVKLLTVFVVLQ